VDNEVEEVIAEVVGTERAQGIGWGWKDRMVVHHCYESPRKNKSPSKKKKKTLMDPTHDMYVNDRVVSHMDMSRECQHESFDELDIE
jgi:hypothetical protein